MIKYYASYNRITLKFFLYLWGLFNNRENADVVTLSFKGITELYKEYAQLHFLKA